MAAFRSTTAELTGVDPLLVVADVAADDALDKVISAALDGFGRIEILHNNVGTGAGDGPPHHLDDDAAFITGVILPVDGGQAARVG